MPWCNINYNTVGFMKLFKYNVSLMDEESEEANIKYVLADRVHFGQKRLKFCEKLKILNM